MMRLRDREGQKFRLISPLTPVIVILITLIAPAQKGTGRLKAEASDVPAQTVERPSPSMLPAPTLLPKQGTKSLAAEATENPFLLPAVIYDSGGSSAFSFAVADVNADGKTDVAVANFCGARGCLIGVLLGRGDGTFRPVQTYEPGGEFPTSIAVADVSGDSKPDLLVAMEQDGQARVEGLVGVLLGNGDGTFQPSITYAAGGRGTMSIGAGDVNGDGKPDIVVANQNKIGVLLGNGDGTFQAARTYYRVGYFYSVVLADVNNDAKLDALLANSLGSVEVFLGNGDGSFQSAMTYNSGGANPWFVTVGDVNGDGEVDVLVANTDSHSVGVLMGNGDGTFQPAAVYESGGINTTSVALADVTGDKKLDMLVTNGCADSDCLVGELSILVGNLDGTFQPAVSFFPGGGAKSVAADDVNRDGKMDALVLNSTLCINYVCGAGNVGVMLNDYGPHTPTITRLASSLNPSVIGEAITVTATVSASSGSPSGPVALYDAGYLVAREVASAGSVSFSIKDLWAGSHSFAAEYQGSREHDRSWSPALTQVVNPGTTTTSLAVSPNPGSVFQPVTYIATVATELGLRVEGTVTFRENGTPVATRDVWDNHAGYITQYKGAGTHVITASYSGNGNFSGSTSPPLTEYVQGSSTTVLSTSRTPSFVAQPVTFTAAVTSRYRFGETPQGGVVTFRTWATRLGSAALVDGKASLTTSSLAAGSHDVKATYAGDTLFTPSTGVMKQVVEKYPTVTTRWSSVNPSKKGQAVTFTARVTSGGPSHPTGKVIFKDGANGIGTALLTGGIAKITKSTLAVGTHAITAVYAGDNASAKSVSTVLNQVVR